MASATIAFQALEMLAQKSDEIGIAAPLREPVPTPSNLRPLLGRYEERNYGGLFHIEFRRAIDAEYPAQHS